MFTGLVQETGLITNIEQNNNSLILTIKASSVLNDAKIGDSIAINGACQTVTELMNDEFKVFVSSETLRVTTFKELKTGSIVNLEKTLRLSDRLDGHLVSGHVDCVGKFLNKKNNGDTVEMYFEIPNGFVKQTVKKGSISINGISLTIADINDNKIMIAVIPHTIENTNLKHLKSGDNVNIETDMIAKYVEKYLSSNHNSSNIDMNFLERNGFL